MSAIPMILLCPSCDQRHVDAGVFSEKEHHTHACQSCGFVWRPAIVATVGVQFLPGFKDDREATNSCGGWRLKEDIGDLRVSTTEKDGHFVTGIKHVSSPQHEGYSDIAFVADRARASWNHSLVCDAVRVALEKTKGATSETRAVVDAAMAFCEDPEVQENYEALEGSNSPSQPVEFVALVEAVKALAAERLK